MSTLGNLSDRISAMTSHPETSFWHKGAALVSDSSGNMYSMWTMKGFPGGASNPTSAAACDRTTAGALVYTNPTGGRQKWLTYMAAAANRGGTSILYDRLLHCGGLSGTSTSAQTVGGSLTRYTNGIGNVAYLEIYTTIGGTPVTATLSYTNDSNASVTSTITVGGSSSGQVARAFCVLPFPLNNGEKGVKSVTSVQLSGSTGTAGNFGITIGHPLVFSPTYQYNSETTGGKVATLGQAGDVEILTDACLAIFFRYPVAQSPFYFNGMIGMVEK